MTAHSPILRPYPDDTAPLGSALNPASLDDDMGLDEDEQADLRRSLRRAGPYRAVLIEAQLDERGGL